jgi:hypothetical protein
VIVFGGKDCYKVWTHGQFACALQHINDQPSMVIWPRRAAPGAGAFIVGHKALHQYFREPFEHGKPSEYGISSCIQALDVMKLSPTDKHACIQLMDILYQYADDLIRMPPDTSPRELAPAVAKAVEKVELLANGETVAEVEPTAH